MGTVKDWMGVLLFGGFWGGGMLLLHAFDRKSSKIKPALSPPGVLLYTFAGLLYGMLVSFHWQAFYWPVVLVTASALLGIALAGWFYGRSQRSRPTS